MLQNMKTRTHIKQSNLPMKKTVLSFIALCVLFFNSYAQYQTHTTAISGIKENSLYKLPLSPVYKQYMASDMHDVRIYDSKQHEVPYVLLSEPLLKAKSDFMAYDILSQDHFNTYSEIIVHNKNKDKISNIAFNINNSDAYKYCSIAGSNDKKQWYSISQLQELSLLYNDVYTNQYKCIYFPLSDYEYFRLSVDDWNSHPLKINSAGYFKNSVIAGKLYDVLFSKTITEDTKNKTTTIDLKFSNNQSVNRLDFKIAAPRLYKRHASIYAKRERTYKNKTEQYTENLVEFDLSSDGSLLVDVPQLNEKELFIEIQNKDNPPLEIESIVCKQLASYLVCDLNAKETYSLKSGNTELKSPEYDLINFVSQIPQLLPEASLGPVTAVPQAKETTVQKEISFFETPQFLWVCLGIGCIIVFFFSKSLLKDMGKKE